MLEYRAARAIAAGEMLTICYLPSQYQLIATPLRRAQLRFTKFFLCQCTRCSAPDTCRQFQHHTCGGFIVPGPENGTGACDTCNGSCPLTTLPLEAEGELQSVVLQLMRGDGSADLDMLSQLREASLASLGERHWCSAILLRFRLQCVQAIYDERGPTATTYTDEFRDGVSSAEGHLAWLERWVQPWYATLPATFALDLCRLLQRQPTAEAKIRVRALARRYHLVLAAVLGPHDPRTVEMGAMSTSDA